MNISFGQHIVNLLKEHECVVLPELGGLLLKNVAAHISNGKAYPSSKIIRFNKNILTDDDLLIADLVNKKQVSYLEAKLQVAKFISNIKFNLQQRGFFTIDDLGRFSLSEDNSLKFIPNTDIENLDKENFGFNSLNIFPIQREILGLDKKLTKTKVVAIQEPVEKKEPFRKIRKPALIGLVATFLLIFGIASLIFSNKTVEGLKVQNANVLNFLVPKDSDYKKHCRNVREIENIQEETGKAKKKKKKAKKKTKKKEEIIHKISKEDIIIDDSRVEKSEELKKYAENLNNDSAESETIHEEIEAKKTTFSHPLIDNILRVSSENPKGYYVVIGAFSSLENANKAKYKCSIDNTCKLFKTKKGMYRVAIFTSEDPQIAVDIVNYYKKQNQSYWLMESY